MKHGELNYYLYLYVASVGNQLTKPYKDDENGRLKQVAFILVYEKIID